MASTVAAIGLTIPAAGFAGRYVLQAMKHMEPQVKQVFQSLPKSAFSGGYDRGILFLKGKVWAASTTITTIITTTTNKNNNYAGDIGTQEFGHGREDKET
uniref:DnaJ heat shock protein family (Hsp40) member C19 n=1 Tax=Saimiri boliviensis boliviensis TaxID=39432 RepID=A0A2K6S8K0_SAIBB